MITIHIIGTSCWVFTLSMSHPMCSRTQIIVQVSGAVVRQRGAYGIFLVPLSRRWISVCAQPDNPYYEGKHDLHHPPARLSDRLLSALRHVVYHGVSKQTVGDFRPVHKEQSTPEYGISSNTRCEGMSEYNLTMMVLLQGTSRASLRIPLSSLLFIE